MPETKNRTIEDISRTWRAGNAYKDRLNMENGVRGTKEVYEQTVDIASEKN